MILYGCPCTGAVILAAGNVGQKVWMEMDGAGGDSDHLSAVSSTPQAHCVGLLSLLTLTVCSLLRCPSVYTPGRGYSSGFLPMLGVRKTAITIGHLYEIRSLT